MLEGIVENHSKVLWQPPVPKSVLGFLAYTMCVAEDASRRLELEGKDKGFVEARVDVYKALTKGALGCNYTPAHERQLNETLENSAQSYREFARIPLERLEAAGKVRNLFRIGWAVHGPLLGIYHVTLYTPCGKRHILLGGNRLDMFQGMNKTKPAAADYVRSRLGPNYSLP